MLFTRSPKVVVRYRLRSSLPGVMELTMARPMTKRSLSLSPSTVRTPQTLWEDGGPSLGAHIEHDVARQPDQGQEGDAVAQDGLFPFP